MGGRKDGEGMKRRERGKGGGEEGREEGEREGEGERDVREE